MTPRLGQPAALLVGAALLVWPAFYNRYPILFSDTGGLLDMGLLPSIGWDKPFVYGPLVAAISLRVTLWLPLLAQGLLLSYVLSTLRRAYAAPTPARHIALCATLAIASTAPWFTATLMPDVFTPVVALAFIAADTPTLPPRHRVALTLIAAIAIAAHLSHLVLAAALIPTLALLHRHIPWRPIASLAAALLYLLASNWIGHGRPAISPYGSVFALARLIADGPARDYLDRTCPQTRWLLCPWRSQLTDDSDQFLWDAKSPFWADPAPLPDFAAQATQIVQGTIRTEPLPVLRNAYRNAAHQLIRTDLGDTLVPDYLADTARPRLERFYPPAELHRFDASRQASGPLPLAATLRPLIQTLLAAALLTNAAILLKALLASSFSLSPRERAGVRAAPPPQNPPRAHLAALVLIALAANAFATGALSAVHDRYQARLAWILLLPVLIPPRPHPTPSGAARTSAA